MMLAKLPGFFKGGRQDFESCVAKAMTDLLKTEQVAERRSTMEGGVKNMPVICKKPLIFSSPATEEDLRIDTYFSNPFLVNTFDGFDKVDRLERYLIDACYGTSAKCSKTPDDEYIPVLRMNNI